MHLPSPTHRSMGVISANRFAMKMPWLIPPIGTAKNHPLISPRIVVITLSSGVTMMQAMIPGTTT